MSRYGIKSNLTTYSCSECKERTLYRCMECRIPVCPMCQFSMHAMCRKCRDAYVGPIHLLGKRADAYIRKELDNIFV